MEGSQHVRSFERNGHGDVGNGVTQRGAASHGQPPCRAGHPRLGRGQGQPIGAAPACMASCGQPARAAAARSVTPAKGQATGRCAQVAATSGQAARGGCRLRRGSGDGGKERAKTSF
ncbi:hypothetical protein GW17_00006965 [Ensete ventricosum]|nr:hypothetical protein GW17_00006965 [Ensete ventricosum]